MLNRFAKLWLIWLAVSVILSAYVALGIVAAKATVAQLKLTPGETIELSVFRLFDHFLVFNLEFAAPGCSQRSELGSWSQSLPEQEPGLLKLRPGADVLIDVASNGQTVRYEAMPLSSYCHGNGRNMTSNLSIAPGVWRWPPPEDRPRNALPAGSTPLTFRVVNVGDPLVGEEVGLIIHPAAGFKTCYEPACVFAPGLLLWPVLFAIQVLWGIALGLSMWRIRRRELQEASRDGGRVHFATVGEIISGWWAVSSRKREDDP